MHAPGSWPTNRDQLPWKGNDSLLLGALTLLALVLRLARLGFQPLWWDEGWSLYFATTDVGSLLRLTAVDIHPPGYYLLLHLWIQAFGPSPLSIRLLSVLIGTATVLLIGWVGRIYLGRRGGFLAAFLLAVSPFHIFYSQEVRMYGLATLLGLAALHWGLQTRRAQGQAHTAAWLGYVLAATAALYTEYYVAFVLLGLNLGLLAYGRAQGRRAPALTRPQALSWFSAQAAVALLYLPWLLFAGEKLYTYVRFKVSVEEDIPQGVLAYVARHIAAFQWGHTEGALARWWWLGLLPLAALLLSLLLVFRSRGRRQPARDLQGAGGPQRAVAAVAVMILAVSLICGFVMNLLFPFNPPRGERLLLPALPAYLLLVSYLSLALGQRRRAAVLATGAVLLVLTTLSLGFFCATPRYPEDDYRPLIAQVRALSLPSDAVVCVHPWQVGYFQAYIPNQETRPELVLTPQEVLPRLRQQWIDTPEQMAADLEQLLRGHQRLWLPAHQTMGRILEDQIQAHLTASAYPVMSRWYGESTLLSLFAAGQPVLQPVTGRFGEWLALESAALSTGPLEAGWGVLAVDLTWTFLAPPAEEVAVGLRLIGPTGYVWAQRDEALWGASPGSGPGSTDEPGLDRHGLLIPAGTPPGEYQVALRAYRSQDLAPLPFTYNGAPGVEMPLGAIRVIRPVHNPPPEALDSGESLSVRFGTKFRLVGFRLGDTTLLPGQAAEVMLHWQTLVDPGQDYLPRLELLDAEGRSLAEQTEKPVQGTYPTAWWRAGELVRDPHALWIPAATPAGRYELAVSLIRAADGVPVPPAGRRTSLTLSEIEILGRERHYGETRPAHEQKVRLDSAVELVGYDLSALEASPGSDLVVTLHWHALETPGRAYHAFVHLLDDAGAIITQTDGPPGEGQLPTRGWLPGETLLDPHSLTLPADLPLGTYRLGVGLYDPATGVRLGERVLLDRLFTVVGNR
jgi:4-amino-4-deoxy-L-arabinose transferase-like glycosyltransferase